MGTIRNEMTIVHSCSKDILEKLREDAIKMLNQTIIQEPIPLEPQKYIESMISPIMCSFVNEEYTFVIDGDCSKIGWSTAERFHEARMKWCEEHKNDVYIIVINFGEDGEARIVFDNTAEVEE